MPGLVDGTTQALTTPPPRGRRGSTTTTQQSFSKLPSFVQQSIIVGCPKEIKPQEDRVGIVPSAAAEYIANGHQVVVESNAGIGSGFADCEYVAVGCTVLSSAKEVYGCAQMVVKVKEPQPAEYSLLREGQVVFAYFHFAASLDLTEAMLKSRVVCVCYETVKCSDGTLPLLTPMSEIAGRMSIQEGAKFLEKPMGGRGVLLSGVPGVHPARIVILGGGVVGFNAAKIAAGNGSDVIIMDINVQRLRYLDDVLPKNCRTLYCNAANIRDELMRADLVIGAVLVPGARAPKLVRMEHLKLMRPGTLMVDVAVDQGGCFESTRVTTHENPTYVVEGIKHYCVGNMPGAVPITSTLALNNVTLKYGLQLANKGWYEACQQNAELRAGLDVCLGHVICSGVSGAFDMKQTKIDVFMKECYEQAQACDVAMGVKRLASAH
eukprot:GHVQ01000932.1.p1 GENE.GHVQ01000932.1~~GHVQ01000932.1.p1  ORF type:complete len:435 (+),score=59.52 GHVQ01000932.1:152-1456(+)